jgi:hypothetical protein
MALRHLLSRAGWTPGAAPTKPDTPAGSAIAIVIDHAGARIYDLPMDDARHTPHETHHLHHSIDRKQHDADREETYPADHRYFDAIAKDVPEDARIVVVSHGKGQSNEGHHLLHYMEKHHHRLYAGIVSVILADLPHTSVSQQIQLARDALRAAPYSAHAITN